MKKEYKFDSKTGTMVEVGGLNIDTTSAPGPSKQEPKKIVGTNVSKKTGGVHRNPAPVTPPVPSGPVQVIKMKRSQTLTPMQLVNDQGLPEAYLSPVNTGILMFREGQDYDVYQIADERSKTVLAYIGGYALRMCFNMQELNTMEKIEQCLEGLKKLFRHQIMNQVLPSANTEQGPS